MDTKSCATRILLIGFGEAGQAFAEGWRQAGLEIQVSAYDIRFDDPGGAPDLEAAALRLGVRKVSHEGRSFADADHVFSLVTADQALLAAEAAARFLADRHVFWDLNSVAPSTKKKASTAIGRSGGSYLDVGVLAPVHPSLHRARLAVAGPTAAKQSEPIASLNLNAEIVSENIGDAATLKLLRSIVIKGIEASVAECVLACRIAGMEVKVLNSLAPSFPGIDWPARADYIMERLGRHGIRRASEMREAAVMLEDLGMEPLLSRGVAGRLQNSA